VLSLVNKDLHPIGTHNKICSDYVRPNLSVDYKELDEVIASIMRSNLKDSLKREIWKLAPPRIDNTPNFAGLCTYLLAFDMPVLLLTCFPSLLERLKMNCITSSISRFGNGRASYSGNQSMIAVVSSISRPCFSRFNILDIDNHGKFWGTGNSFSPP